MFCDEILKAAIRSAHDLQAGSRENGVIGYGIANKVSGGAATDVSCVQFCVRKKRTLRAIGLWCVPPTISVGYGADAATILTDVVEMRHIPRAQRSVDAGASVGHYSGVGGTLGLAVQDKSGKEYGLTCAHVAAPWWLFPKGHAVESPSDSDGVAGPNRMGTVENWVALNATGTNTTDAALILPDSGILLSNDSLGLQAGARFSQATILDYAARRTGIVIHTKRGALQATIEGAYNNMVFEIFGKYFSFSNILCYHAPSLPGDSGSVVMNAEKTLVLGLHFAGEPGAGLGYCVLASNILKAFQRYDLQLKP